MKKHHPRLEAAHAAIVQSELFRLDGPAIDLPAALIELGNAAREADTENDEFVWSRIGEFTKAPLGDLIVGAYWALTAWHAGQISASYAALCALGDVFSPGMSTRPDEDEPGWYAYDAVSNWFQSRTGESQ